MRKNGTKLGKIGQRMRPNQGQKHHKNGVKWGWNGWNNDHGSGVESIRGGDISYENNKNWTKISHFSSFLTDCACLGGGMPL